MIHYPHGFWCKVNRFKLHIDPELQFFQESYVSEIVVTYSAQIPQYPKELTIAPYRPPIDGYRTWFSRARHRRCGEPLILVLAI
jgi:hypothetical protein